MDRRLVAVCATAALSILALVDSTTARTSHKTTPQTRQAVATSRAVSPDKSRSARSRASRTCDPCTAQTAAARARTQKRAAKTARNIPCHPKGYIDPKIALNYNAALRDMKREGIKPQVTSTWRSSEYQEQLYRCSQNTRCRRANPGLYRALPPGESLHEAGLAIDMSGIAAGPRGRKSLTSRGKRIVGIMRKRGFNWRYGLADPAHFEADPRKHGYRNLKQAIARTRTTCQVQLANEKTHKKPANKIAATRVTVSAKGRRHS